ncbi:MAG: hypothetical protein HY231_12910 [Acidobacteria bacterium]|nr:hypothetical protein [Acidobacteriota bacterium]
MKFLFIFSLLIGLLANHSVAVIAQTALGVGRQYSSVERLQSALRHPGRRL